MQVVRSFRVYSIKPFHFPKPSISFSEKNTIFHVFVRIWESFSSCNGYWVSLTALLPPPSQHSWNKGQGLQNWKMRLENMILASWNCLKRWEMQILGFENCKNWSFWSTKSIKMEVLHFQSLTKNLAKSVILSFKMTFGLLWIQN